MAQAQHADPDAETDDLTTPFDTPIKLSLHVSTDARRYFMRECEVYEADNGSGDMHTACRDAVNTARQKTNMVFKTPREALSFFIVADYAHTHSKQQRKAAERTVCQMQIELAKRGYKYEDNDFNNVDYHRIDEANGTAPDTLDYSVGDEVSVDVLDDLIDRWTVEAISETHTFVVRRRSKTRARQGWVPHEYVSELGQSHHEWVVARRREADKDALLDVFEQHLRTVANNVWGNTLDLDAISVHWNNRFSQYGGMYYPRAYRGYGDRPSKPSPCIEIAWHYYLQHGLSETLAVLRHEAAHAWQDYHPDFNKDMTKPHSHHGPKFKQWCDDLDTHVHCKHFSRQN